MVSLFQLLKKVLIAGHGIRVVAVKLFSSLHETFNHSCKLSNFTEKDVGN